MIEQSYQEFIKTATYGTIEVPGGLSFAYHFYIMTIYMYCGETDSKYISLAWKLGLHPSTLARLTTITSILPKQVPL